MPINRKKLISVVVPTYNEEEALAEFHKRLSSVIADLTMTFEIIYVNDGSTDATFDILQDMHNTDPRIVVIDLSRNFGKEIALTAGLDHAQGDAAIPIDADLQDPPELIGTLIDKWIEGYNVVYARRKSRVGETWLKKRTASAFYRLMQHVGGRVSIPQDTGDFRLLDRKALDAIKQCREQHRFMKGLFSVIGFRQTAIPYERDARYAGNTKFNYWKLWNFSLEGITSYTIAPLKVSTYLGTATAALAFVYGLYILFKALLFGDPVAGFPSLMVIVSFLGGVQLTVLGVLGEYVGRIFNETKQRPLYFIQNILREPTPSSDLGSTKDPAKGKKTSQN